MTEIKDAALGIDLGTTCCVVSVVINGKVVLIPNRSQNSNVTPSYVCYSEGKETFGVVAKDQAYRFPECTIFNAKRIIGRTWGDPVLQAEMKQWPFEVKSFNGFPKIKIGKKTRNPQEISGRLLEIFCREAEKHLQLPTGSVTKAVITVPANFNALQRRATIEAGEIAGMEVLDILNEPTAAAIAYKFEGRGEQRTKTLLIYDLGGGTFDVAIVKVTHNSVLCLNIDGDTHLGGEDFDNAMVTHCVAKFQKEVGVNLLEKKDMFKSAVARLRLQCEKAKMALSSCDVHAIDLDCIYQEHDLNVEVTRAEFEGLIKPHVEMTIEIVNRAIQNAKDIRSPNDIDEIILIGGSTRIPLVHTRLANAFPGKALNFAIDPELTVSGGAAVHAAILSGTCEGVKIQDFQIKEQPSPKKEDKSAHGTESLEAAEGLVEYRIGLRVQSLPAPKLLKITKSSAQQPVDVSKVPQFNCEFSSLLSMEENRVLLNALDKGQKTKIVVVGSMLVPSVDSEGWGMKHFNHPICLIMDDVNVNKFYFIQAFHLKQKKFVYRKKVEQDFSYITPKPGFLAFEDDDGLLFGVLFHDFTEAHLFSETLKILLEELKRDSERAVAVGGARSKPGTVWPFSVKSQPSQKVADKKFYSDANETDSSVTEKPRLVESTDYGEPSAQALLQRHLNLEEEITAYENGVKGLNARVDKLLKAGINSIQEMSQSSATTTPAQLPVTGQQHHHQNRHSSPSDHNNSTASAAAPAEDDVEYVTEQKLVPQEYFEYEMVERTDYKTVTEGRAVPQVKALYAFQGQDIEMKKGEVMFLLNKTNSDWWNVGKANGEYGFVPANYVKEVDPKVPSKQMIFEESAVFKEINNDMRNLAISSGYSVKTIQLIWIYHFESVSRKVEAGECLCGTICQVNLDLANKSLFPFISFSEPFKQKYESILKRTVEGFNAHRDRTTQDCFCRRVLKKKQSAHHFDNVRYEALSDLENLAETSGYDSKIFAEIAETRRGFCKDNLEKNVCVCRTFHCPNWKLVGEKSGHSLTETFKRKYESIFKVLTEEFNKHQDEGNQDCFCRTVTRPLLVELRLSKSEKGVQILKEIAETKASAGEAFKMLNIFSSWSNCWDFVYKLTEEKCMCKTLFSWIWEETCEKSPQMKREASFKSKFEPTFQRAVQEFNELRDEASEDCFCKTFTGFQEEKYFDMTLQSRANYRIWCLRVDDCSFISKII